LQFPDGPVLSGGEVSHRPLLLLSFSKCMMRPSGRRVVASVCPRSPSLRIPDASNPR
jgi:hypothetical protein